MACLMHTELLFPVSLGPCSELGEKEEKIVNFLLPNPPLGSHRSPIFFLFNPIFCLPPPFCLPGPTLPFSQRMYAFAFQHIGFVPRECAKGLFSFLI